MLPGGRAALLRVCGEVDLATAPAVRWGVTQAFTAAATAGVGMVAVDLGEVTFFASAGLSVLLEAHGQAERRGMEFAVVVPPGHPVRRLLKTTELDLALSVDDTVEQALTRPPHR